MSKTRDDAWAKEMLETKPPKGYAMTLVEGYCLTRLGDPLYSVSAAYNYGFLRGKRFGGRVKKG